MNKQYIIGSDPEVFIKNENGTISSSIGLFKGTKDNPINIGEGCFIQEDNILVEFNIPPVKTLNNFLKYINYSKNYIETILKPLNKQLHYSSSELVPNCVLTEPKAHEFGCEPSFNVITDTDSSFDIEDVINKNIRSSGFHIHIGYDNPTEKHNERLVLCFELFVTLPLLKYDNDLYDRRSLYGKIGDSRSKSYGVECRSLGGFFLKNNELITTVWNQIQKALLFADNSILTNNELKDMISFCINDDIINLELVDLVLSHLKLNLKTNKIINKICVD